MSYTIYIKKAGETSQPLAHAETLEETRHMLVSVLAAHANSLESMLDPETLDAMQTVIEDVKHIDLNALATFRAYLPASVDYDDIPALFYVSES